MKQTVVEWLYNNLKSYFEHDGDLLEVVQFSFEQAKEMENKQQGYSEEDMRDYANYRLLIKKALDPKEWFEQFKKK